MHSLCTNDPVLLYRTSGLSIADVVHRRENSVSLGIRLHTMADLTAWREKDGWFTLARPLESRLPLII